jgi:hypothetical protein
VTDLPTGLREPKSTVLTVEQEAIIVAFRKHTLLPLDDCLYALQATIRKLTRSSLHRCLQRHGIARLPDVEGDKPLKKKFKAMQSVTSMSILLKFKLLRASSIYLLLLIEPASLSSSNCMPRAAK